MVSYWSQTTTYCLVCYSLSNYAGVITLTRQHILTARNWIGLSSVLRPRQHSIAYMGDGFYRLKDPTNSIKVLKENLQRTNQTTKKTKYTYALHRQ